MNEEVEEVRPEEVEMEGRVTWQQGWHWHQLQGLQLQKDPDPIRFLNEDGVAGSTPVADHDGPLSRIRRILNYLTFPLLGLLCLNHTSNQRENGAGLVHGQVNVRQEKTEQGTLP